MQRKGQRRTMPARTAICCAIAGALLATVTQVATAAPADSICESGAVQPPSNEGTPPTDVAVPSQTTELPIVECLPTPINTDDPTAIDTADPPETTAPAPDTGDTSSTEPSLPETTTDPEGASADTRAAEAITISASPLFTGSPETLQPGQTWTGTVMLSVTNSDPSIGWTSTVSLSNPQGLTTGRVFTPTSATYSAPTSPCSADGTPNAAVSVPLTPVAVPAKTGRASCNTTWQATVSIEVPATDVVADTYSTTLTHSIY